MDKKKRLKEKIKEYGKEDICVAFSGGVDSSLLLKLACDAALPNGKKVYAFSKSGGFGNKELLLQLFNET